MRQIILAAAIACVAGCASSPSDAVRGGDGHTVSPSADPASLRSVDGHTVISRADPAARFIIDPSLDYLGHTESVVMNNQATAEQFWFGEIHNGQLQRAVVVHFEHWNDDESVFNYPTFRMRRAGSHDYLHQSFPAPECGLISAGVRALLTARNASAAQGCLMTRFVRATDETMHAEIILFYLEPGSVAEQPPEGFAPGGLPAEHNNPGAATTPWGAIDARLTEQLERLVRVED